MDSTNDAAAMDAPSKNEELNQKLENAIAMNGKKNGKSAKKKRGKQDNLPGVGGGKVYKDIDDVAEEYADLLYNRMAMQTEEAQLREQLVEKMKKYNLDKYRVSTVVPALTLELCHNEKVKVRKEREESGE